MALTEKRLKLKGEILTLASELFRSHGIKAVKMDDISAQMKISKRTLYEVYDNKRDLLFDVLVIHGERLSESIRKFAEENNNVMDILIEFFRLQTETYTSTNPAFYKDLTKYPDLLQRLSELHEEQHRNTEAFFKRGVENGYFLDTIDYNLLSRICRNTMQALRVNPEFENCNVENMFRSFICVIIRGFCTQKGLLRLDEFVLKLNMEE